MDTVLQMLKIDLGINHTLRDEYFEKMIAANFKELSSRGVKLDLENVEDIMLLSDYCAFVYRKRMEDVPMSRNLSLRISNKKIKGRCGV